MATDYLSKYKWLIASALVLSAVGLVAFYYSRRTKLDFGIVIGDSQAPFIAKQTTKAKLLDEKGGEGALWEGGKNLSWLKKAVDKYPQNRAVGSVVVSIGTNGGFNPQDDVDGLLMALKAKFPNAKIYVVQGSWGWGGNKNVTDQMVRSYYAKFKGATIIEPPIGKVADPHGNLPIYQTIGKALDRAIN